MRVPPRNNQGQQGKVDFIVSLLPLFEQHGMNVSFQMVHGDQRLVERERQRFGVADADKQRAGKSGTLSHGERVDGLVTLTGLGESLAHHRDYGP